MTLFVIRELINGPFVVAAHFEGPKFRAITVRKGHEASLKCEAEGDPPLSVSWMKDKVPLNTKEETRYELIETPTGNGVVSEVIIRNSDRRDSSLFTCSAYNSFGKFLNCLYPISDYQLILMVTIFL